MGKLDRDIEAAYQDKTTTLKEAAERLGISYNYLTKRAHYMGIKRPNTLTRDDEFWIWQLHRLHKLPLDEIAEKFEISRYWTYRTVQKHDAKRLKFATTGVSDEE